jgi:hypothetical protein
LEINVGHTRPVVPVDPVWAVLADRQDYAPIHLIDYSGSQRSCLLDARTSH